MYQFKHDIPKANIHCRVNIFRDCETTIKPLIHLLIPKIQELHGYQEGELEGRQVIINRTGK